MTRRSRAAAVALVALALAAPASAFDELLDRAAFRAGAATRPPADDAPGWTTVSLPDRWGDRRPETAGEGWYRLAFELDAMPAEPLAVYIDHLSMNGALWLNGSWIGQHGSMDPPVAQNWNRPLLFPLPVSLLHPGTNELYVQLHRLPHCYGGLGPVRIGDAAELGALHARQTFWRVDVARASTVASVLFAAIMLAFWLGTRDPAYGAFSVVCMVIAISNLNFHVRDIPLSSQRWEALVCSAALLGAAAFWMFAQRLAGLRRTRFECALLAYTLTTGALFFVDHRWFHPLFNALGLIALGLCVHAALVIARHARSEDWPSAAIYTAVGDADARHPRPRRRAAARLVAPTRALPASVGGPAAGAGIRCRSDAALPPRVSRGRGPARSARPTRRREARRARRALRRAAFARARATALARARAHHARDARRRGRPSGPHALDARRDAARRARNSPMRCARRSPTCGW